MPKPRHWPNRRYCRPPGEGLPAIALRPHLIWGPGGLHLIDRIISRAKRLRIVGNGSNKVDTIYVDNAAWAHVLADDALKAQSGSLRPHLFRESGPADCLCRNAQRHPGRRGELPPITRKVSPTLARLAAVVCEGIYKTLGIESEPPITRFQVDAMAHRSLVRHFGHQARPGVHSRWFPPKKA